jgi:hypothetical protein
MAKKPKEELSDEEAERRATEALRRALATPYKPQKELSGRGGGDRAAIKKKSKKPKK